MPNPYETLPKSSFWRLSVADVNMLEISSLWKAKNEILVSDTVATAGSCFAQHISRAMIANGFKWIDGEPAPETLPESMARKFGYGVFSFRTGNIYTASALRQWVEAAFGVKDLPDELWEAQGRFFDPYRPQIEPHGFVSAEECLDLRRSTLRAIRDVLSRVNIFVFTLGLTESWRNKHTGTVYAACPGTLAGEFSEVDHEFYNQKYPEIRADMEVAFACIRARNPGIKFLLTVSPVPLVATAAPNHVLVSTVYSKSVLRAVAGDLCETWSDVDYFPSYEIINATPFRGSFFQPNQREVAKTGVAFVMQHFFAGIGMTSRAKAPAEPSRLAAPSRPAAPADSDFDVQCEEALLEAFKK